MTKFAEHGFVIPYAKPSQVINTVEGTTRTVGTTRTRSNKQESKSNHTSWCGNTDTRMRCKAAFQCSMNSSSLPMGTRVAFATNGNPDGVSCVRIHFGLSNSYIHTYTRWLLRFNNNYYYYYVSHNRKKHRYKLTRAWPMIEEDPQYPGSCFM